jgi:hypothetical protein
LGKRENRVTVRIVKNQLVDRILQRSITIEQKTIFLQNAIMVSQITSVQHIAEISHEKNHRRPDDMVRVHKDNSDADVILLIEHNLVRDIVVHFDDEVSDSGELQTEKGACFRRAVDFSVLEVVGDSAVVVLSAYLHACG